MLRPLRQQRQRSAGAQRLGLPQIFDPAAQRRAVAEVLFDHLRQVIDGEEDAADAEADEVENDAFQDGAARHLDHRLGKGIGQGSEALPASARHDDGPVRPRHRADDLAQQVQAGEPALRVDDGNLAQAAGAHEVEHLGAAGIGRNRGKRLHDVRRNTVRTARRPPAPRGGRRRRSSRPAAAGPRPSPGRCRRRRRWIASRAWRIVESFPMVTCWIRSDMLFPRVAVERPGRRPGDHDAVGDVLGRPRPRRRRSRFPRRATPGGRQPPIRPATRARRIRRRQAWPRWPGGRCRPARNRAR